MNRRPIDARRALRPRRRWWLDALDAATSIALYLWVLTELQKSTAQDEAASVERTVTAIKAYERGRADEHERMAHTLIRDHAHNPAPAP